MEKNRKIPYPDADLKQDIGQQYSLKETVAEKARRLYDVLLRRQVFQLSLFSNANSFNIHYNSEPVAVLPPSWITALLYFIPLHFAYSLHLFPLIKLLTSP